MGVLALHDSAFSPFARKVRIALALNGIEHAVIFRRGDRIEWMLARDRPNCARAPRWRSSAVVTSTRAGAPDGGRGSPDPDRPDR
jgi:hypothetical protein